MKKIFIMLFAVTLVLAGCGSTSDKIELTFATWDQSMTDAYEIVAQDYEKINPDVTIKFETYSWDEYQTSMIQRAQTDELPDILSIHPSFYRTFQEGDVLVPLDDFWDTYASKYDYSQEDFPVTPQFETDGIPYAIPRDTAYTLYMYDKNLFDQAGVEYPQEGWTVDDFYETVEALSQGLPEGTYPLFNNSSSQNNLWGWELKNNAQIATEAGTFDENAINAYLEYWHLTSDGYSKKPSEVVDDSNEYLTGKVALMNTGSWVLTSYMDDPDFVARTGVVSMPYYDDGKSMSVFNNNASSVTTSSEHPEEAKDFVAYLGTEEASKVLMENSDLVAARKSDYSEFFAEKYAAYPMYNDMHNTITNTGIAFPSLGAGVEDILNEYNSKILEADSKEDVLALVDECSKKVDALYE